MYDMLTKTISIYRFLKLKMRINTNIEDILGIQNNQVVYNNNGIIYIYKLLFFIINYII